MPLYQECDILHVSDTGQGLEPWSSCRRTNYKATTLHHPILLSQLFLQHKILTNSTRNARFMTPYMKTFMALLVAPKYVLTRYTCRDTAHTPINRIHSTAITGPQHRQKPRDTVKSNCASRISSVFVPSLLSDETRNL